jgi:PAS domain S-box-containing protein
MNLCKKIIWIFCANFLAFIMIIMAYAAESTEPLIFAGDMNYPPFESIKDGQPIGINIDILRALSKVMHRDIKIQLMKWSEAQQMLKDGKVDALTEMAYTKSRAEFFDFSEQTVLYKYSFFIRKDDENIQHLSDLEGKIIAVTKGGYPRQILKSNKKNKFYIMENNLDGFKQLLAGAVDVVATDYWVGGNTLEENNLKSVIKFETRPFAEKPGFIPVKKGNTALLSEINQGIAKLRKEGVIQKIFDKWSGKSFVFITKEKLEKLTTIVGLTLTFIIILFIVFWIYILKKRLKSKTADLQKAHDNLEGEVQERTINLQQEIAGHKSVRKKLIMTQRLLTETEKVGKVGGWEFNIDTKKMTWTKEIYNIHEIDPTDDLTVIKGVNFYTPASKPIIEQAVQRAINHGEPFDLELEIITAKGNLRAVHTIGKSDLEHHRVHGFFQDITIRKILQKESEINKTILLEAEKLAGFGGWQWDIENDFWTLSQNWLRIHGCSNKHLATEELIKITHPDDIPKIKKAFDRVVKEGGTYHIDHRIIDQTTGEIKEIHAYGEARLDDSGKAVQIFGAAQDITDKKKLETKLQQAQKMESIGTLAGGIAHDFNNILSSIIGFSELALGEAEKGTELEDNLQEVRMAGLRAKDLVKQILTFARQSDEAVKPIQVDIISKEVLKFIKSSIPSTIQINDKINSDSFIMGSPTQIHQVLMNLCTNAAYSMEENGGILEFSLNDIMIDRMIMISDLRRGEYIEIKVTDTGIGISPQYIHTIFEPYFTTKPVGEGTGMGLAVVHGIVEKYGGQITVNSTIGKGTCFTIYLPITKKRKVHTHSEKKDLPVGTENILFVDDEASITKMGSKILEQLGYSVTTRTSSLKALELFRSKPNVFDLVVTDMTMPNMTGDKLAIELIKIRSDIPVILCTGYSKKISEETAAEIGIKKFVHKPMAKADLARTVRKLLDETKSFS